MNSFKIKLVLGLILCGTAIFPQIVLAGSQIQIFGSQVKDGVTASRDVKIKLLYQPIVEKSQTNRNPLPAQVKESQQNFQNTEDCRKMDNNQTACNNTSICTYTPGNGICKSKDLTKTSTPLPVKQGANTSGEESNSEFFRIANSLVELNTTAEVKSLENSTMEVNWQLSKEDGLKTIYAQFKSGGQWQQPISTTVTLKESVSKLAVLQSMKQDFLTRVNSLLMQMRAIIFKN